MYIQLNDKKFLYKQIYDHIRKEIIENRLKYGEKLPSIRQLSTKLNISKNTVETAYYQLEQEGFIKPVEKSGFFVEKIEEILIMDNKNDNIKSNDFSSKKDLYYKYDFSFGGVDKDSFNFNNLKKSFKDSIIEDEIFLKHTKGLGDEKLQKSIANFLYSFRNIKASYDQILISTGSNELYLKLLEIFKDKKFGFENPGYAYRGNENYKNFNQAPISLDKEGISIKDLVNNKIDVVSVTPSHQFPLTTIMSITRRAALLNWAYKKKNRYIIEDDYDAEFKYKLNPITPLKKLDINDRVIYMGNFSRVITPALRVSYMVLPKSLIYENKKLFDEMISPASIFVQRALSNYIDNGYLEKQINKSKKIYTKKYDLIKSLLEKEKNIEIISTDSGTSFVIKLADNIDKDKFEENIYQQRINLPKINDFAYENKGFDSMYLLGFAKLSQDEIVSGINLIINIIRDLS